MTLVLVGAVGFLIGLIAHDLGIQALSPDDQLRPLVGVCPRCRTNRGWLKVTCPTCGRRAGRGFVFAIVTGAVAVGFENTLGVSWFLLPYLGLLLLTASLFITDLEEFRIVDRLNLVGTLVLTVSLAVVSFAVGDMADFGRGLLGGLAYLAGTSILFLIGRGQAFGAGDVKLSFQLGLFAAYLSWTTLGQAVFITALAGGALALALILFGNAGRKTELPYGPPMIVGTWAAIILSGIGSGAVGP